MFSNGLLSLSFVERKFIKLHVLHNPISTKRLKKYLKLLSVHVEKKSSQELPDKFVFVLVVWKAEDPQ